MRARSAPASTNVPIARRGPRRWLSSRERRRPCKVSNREVLRRKRRRAVTSRRISGPLRRSNRALRSMRLRSRVSRRNINSLRNTNPRRSISRLRTSRRDRTSRLPAAPPQMPPPPQVFVRPYAPPPPSSGLPVWLLTVLFALATLGVVAGIVWTVGYFHNRPETKPSAATESPAAKPGAAANPLQRYIEISGVRFAEDPRHKDKTLVHFVVTNHSDAEIMGLGGNVTIWGSTRKSEEDAEGTFAFKADVKPMESKELEAPLNTKMKIYELPDWQNVTTDVQITAPAASASSPAR